jgi:hypothetical protein
VTAERDRAITACRRAAATVKRLAEVTGLAGWRCHHIVKAFELHRQRRPPHHQVDFGNEQVGLIGEDRRKARSPQLHCPEAREPVKCESEEWFGPDQMVGLRNH